MILNQYFNYISEKPFCISIVTANEETGILTGGTLKLSINRIVKFEHKLFKPSDEVINECFDKFDSITVQNPSHNEWAGEIKVIKNRKVEMELSCSTGCSGEIFNGKIIVDGNNGTDVRFSKTFCNNGNACTFKLKGRNVLI